MSTANSRRNPTKTNNKEMQVSLQIKNECIARAMKIVEFSIEGKLNAISFQHCLLFINQSYYQDIVEERAISKLCGYPICDKPIPEMPKKQFMISTKCNRVYDITERKNFCSNHCYTASLHIQNQIDNSPLWLRNFSNIPKLHFLSATDRGMPGKYIPQEAPKTVIEPTFTSISSYAASSLEDIFDSPVSSGSDMKYKGSKGKSKLKQPMKTINECEPEDNVVSCNEKSEDKGKDKSDKKCNKKEDITAGNYCPLVVDKSSNGETEVNSENRQNDKLPQNGILQKSTQGGENLNNGGIIIKNDSSKDSNFDSKKPINVETNNQLSGGKVKLKNQKITESHNQTILVEGQHVENHLKTCIAEWLTLDSYIFLYGEEKIKIIVEQNNLDQYIANIKISELRSTQQIKYISICKKLQLQEIVDKRFDKAFLGSDIKPIPCRKDLKKESKQLELKVQAFYNGDDMYEQNSTHQDKNESQENDAPLAVLPLVDANSHNVLRRKIFLNSISKSMERFLQQTHVSSYTSVLMDLQALVKTFNLKSNNIVFKPSVWNYISVIILNMLSLRDQKVKLLLEERQCKEYIDLILVGFPNKNKFISSILKSLEDEELFIKKCIILDDNR